MCPSTSLTYSPLSTFRKRTVLSQIPPITHSQFGLHACDSTHSVCHFCTFTPYSTPSIFHTRTVFSKDLLTHLFIPVRTPRQPCWVYRELDEDRTPYCPIILERVGTTFLTYSPLSTFRKRIVCLVPDSAHHPFLVRTTHTRFHPIRVPFQYLHAVLHPLHISYSHDIFKVPAHQFIPSGLHANLAGSLVPSTKPEPLIVL